MKKIGLMLMAGIMGVCIVGCTQQEVPAKDVTIEEIGSKENEDKVVEAESVKADSAKVESVEAMSVEATSAEAKSDASEADGWSDSRDGWYSATLNSQGKDEIGVANEWGYLPEIAYDVKIENDQLIVYGSMCYSATNDMDSNNVSDDIKHVFPIGPNTELRGGVDESGYTTYTAEEYGKYVADLIDSQLGLIIEVKDGAVVAVSVAP